VAYAKTLHDHSLNGDPIPASTKRALQLLDQLKRICADIWRPVHTDNSLSDIQFNTRVYISTVRDLPNLTPKQVQILDSPNLHRLYEYAHFVLPLLLQPSVTLERNLEKRHQALKRSIERSNNRDPHIFAMQNIALEDWKARLASIALPLQVMNQRDARHARKLLGRPIPLHIASPPLSNISIARLNRVLMGPGFPPSAEFPARGNVCPSTNSQIYEKLWNIAIRAGTAFTDDSDIWEDLPPAAQEYLNAHRHVPTAIEPEVNGLPFLSLPYTPSLFDDNTLPPFRLHVESIIEMSCYCSNRIFPHFPRVLQRERSLVVNPSPKIHNKQTSVICSGASG